MALDGLTLDLAVVLGKARVPLHRLLRMGRGAIVALDTDETELVDILANGLPVARGRVVIRNERVAVEITELVRKAAVIRTPGVTIGGSAKDPSSIAA